MSKHLLNQAFDVSMSQALEAEAQAQSVNSGSQDSREAISAFFEKGTRVPGTLNSVVPAVATDRFPDPARVRPSYPSDTVTG